MKRSDAVELIVNELYEMDDMGSYYYYALKILEKLEKAGMAPPKDKVLHIRKWSPEEKKGTQSD